MLLTQPNYNGPGDGDENKCHMAELSVLNGFCTTFHRNFSFHRKIFMHTRSNVQRLCALRRRF